MGDSSPTTRAVLIIVRRPYGRPRVEQRSATANGLSRLRKNSGLIPRTSHTWRNENSDRDPASVWNQRSASLNNLRSEPRVAVFLEVAPYGVVKNRQDQPRLAVAQWITQPARGVADEFELSGL